MNRRWRVVMLPSSCCPLLQGALMVTDDEFVQGLQRCKELGALVQVVSMPHFPSLSRHCHTKLTHETGTACTLPLTPSTDEREPGPILPTPSLCVAARKDCVWRLSQHSMLLPHRCTVRTAMQWQLVRPRCLHLVSPGRK